MIESNYEKKRLFYIIVLILTLITMIIGATLAYFLLMGSQKEEGTSLYTGTLKINYIDGVYIKDPELFPTKQVDYNTYKGVYRNNFSVASTGTLDQTISIDMDVSINEFVPNTLKYAIYNSEGKQMSSGYVPEAGSSVNLTNNLYLAHNETAKYTLIIWWDNTKENQNSEMGSRISGRITIYAKQVKK